MATKSKTPLTLRPARPEDVPQMVDIWASAFAGNLVHQTVFPASSPQSTAFWLTALSEEIKDENARFLVVTDPAAAPEGEQQENAETIVAFAKWVVPGAPKSELPPADVWPTDGDPAFAVPFFAELFRRHEEIMQDRRHWYLELIGTRREYQGRGAGALLMRWGINRADEEGLECYLDATPEGLGVYLYFGFRIVYQGEYLDGRYKHYYMVRDAPQSGEKSLEVK